MKVTIWLPSVLSTDAAHMLANNTVIVEQECRTCLCYVSFACHNHSPVTSMNTPEGSWHGAHWPMVSEYDWCRDYSPRPDQAQKVTKNDV